MEVEVLILVKVSTLRATGLEQPATWLGGLGQNESNTSVLRLTLHSTGCFIRTSNVPYDGVVEFGTASLTHLS